MGRLGQTVRKVLYRNLSLDNYLKLLSGSYLLGLRWGIGRGAVVYEYPRYLKNLVSEGDTVIDIGANLGYYSYALARLVGDHGRVYAVEPVRPILNVLRHNLRRFHNVEILNYALGDRNATILMGNSTVGETGYFGTGQNFVVDRPTDGLQMVEFEAEMRCGSELFDSLQRLDFIKCDIEGYEVVVLGEMRPLLERFHPTVLCETGGENRRQMVELFRSLGYAAYTLENGDLIPLTDRSEKDIVFRPLDK